MGVKVESEQYDVYKATEKGMKAHDVKKNQTLEAMIQDLDNMITYYERKIDQYRNEIEKYRTQKNILAELLAA